MAHLIHAFPDVTKLYAHLLTKALTEGDVVSPRGQSTFELRNVTIEMVPDDVLLTGIGRGISPQLAALEALQLVAGTSDPDLTVHVVPNYGQFMNGGQFHGAYGIRTRGKISNVLRRLTNDVDTRQANMQFWSDAEDLYLDGYGDFPCTMHANFAIRFNKLDMTIVMRSNDLWWGFPYDIFQFSTLQKTIAACLGIEPGLYTHIAHSLHLYERNVEDVYNVIERSNKHGYRGRELRPYLDMGGVDAESNSWRDFEDRAFQILSCGQGVSPRNETEAYLIDASYGWRDYVLQRNSNG